MRRASVSKAQKDRLRRKLLEKRDWLEKEIALRIRDTSGCSMRYPCDSVDRASATLAGELSVALAEEESKALSETNEALDRLHDGDYGICEQCWQPIAISRLRAIPSTTLCRACKQEQEDSQEWSGPVQNRAKSDFSALDRLYGDSDGGAEPEVIKGRRAG